MAQAADSVAFAADAESAAALHAHTVPVVRAAAAEESDFVAAASALAVAACAFAPVTAAFAAVCPRIWEAHSAVAPGEQPLSLRHPHAISWTNGSGDSNRRATSPESFCTEQQSSIKLHAIQLMLLWPNSNIVVRCQRAQVLRPVRDIGYSPIAGTAEGAAAAATGPDAAPGTTILPATAAPAGPAAARCIRWRSAAYDR